MKQAAARLIVLIALLGSQVADGEQGKVVVQMEDIK
jgi:hypothetical protein